MRFPGWRLVRLACGGPLTAGEGALSGGGGDEGKGRGLRASVSLWVQELRGRSSSGPVLLVGNSCPGKFQKMQSRQALNGSTFAFGLLKKNWICKNWVWVQVGLSS